MNSQSLAAEAAEWKNSSSGTRWERFRDSGQLDSEVYFADSPFNRWPLQISALLAASVIVSGLLLMTPLRQPSQIQTAAGEQRSLALADGSVVELDMSSEVSIAFTARERRVLLTRGKARIVVTQDASRPFLVSTPQATARVVGATLEVRSTPKQTEVQVLEGRLAILPPLLDELPAEPAAPKFLAAGEKALVADDGEITVSIAQQAAT